MLKRPRLDTVAWLALCGAVILPAFIATAEIGPANRVLIIHTPKGGEPVDAKMSTDGTIHLLYNSGDIPYYVTSTDHGASFATPISVVNKEARRSGLVFDGWGIAVGKDGTVHAAMSTNNWKIKLSDVPEGFVYAKLAPGAKSFTPVTSLNKRPSEGFSIATDSEGNVAATWLADKLFVNFSRDGGRTFTPNAELNPAYDPCNCCTTHAVYGTDGKLAVLYREETNNQRDMYLVVLDKNGGQSRTRVSGTLWNINGCPMTYYSISATKDGYIAAWPTKGEIYFTRLDGHGNVLPPGEIKTPGRSGMRTGIVALGAPDGTAFIVWKHQDELNWQLYDQQGHPQGALGSTKSAGKGAAALVDDHGRFIVFP